MADQVSDREPWYMVRGDVTIDIRATTCPRCNTGTEALCPHIERVIQAVVERARRTIDRRVREDLDAVVADMRRNRAALAASGPWDVAELASGTAPRNTWRQTHHRHPHHTTGGNR